MMRYTTLLLVAALVTLSACKTTPATTDPTELVEQPNTWATPPEFKEFSRFDGEPEVKTLGEKAGVTALRVGELLVLHKPTPANQVVSAQLYFIGGARRLNDVTSGIERMALDVATSGGTTSTPKDAFNAKLDGVGASIGSFTDRDYSGVAMKTIVPHFDEVWDLYMQTVLEPAMPDDVIELTRKRQLQQIDALLESPDSQVSYIATQALFDGHPYKHMQLGTRPTVEKFDRAALLAWQRALVQPDQMVLVVVGNIPRDQLVSKVKGSLGQIKSTLPAPAALPDFPSQGPKFVFEQKELPTNYVFGLFQAPEPGDKDYAPMVVAMDYLSDKLFEEVRTKRNLTYAVSAGLSSRKANYGYLYVTAADPATTLGVMMTEVDKLKGEAITDQKIKETLNVYLTNHYMSQETNASQAGDLAHAYITTGNWEDALTFLDEVRAVTPADIQRVTKTYMKGFHFGVVGPDEAKLPKDLMNQ